MITLEESLKPILIQNGSKIISSAFRDKFLEYGCIDEINSSFGVVDLLFYKLDNGYIKERRNTLPITSPDIIKTLLIIKNKKTFSISYLKNNLPFSEERIEKILLKFLLSRGFVRRIDRENFKKIFNYKIGLEKTLAIELKLKDWKRGLYQAYKYKFFSEVSYLALYCKYINQAKRNLNLFKQYNVGLIEIFDDRNIDIIHKPKIEKPYSKNARAITNENLIKRLLL